MNTEQRQKLQVHISEIAKLLYADAETQGMPMGNLAEIEQTVRHQLLHHVSPQLGNFLSTHAQPQTGDTPEP